MLRSIARLQRCVAHRVSLGRHTAAVLCSSFLLLAVRVLHSRGGLHASQLLGASRSQDALHASQLLGALHSRDALHASQLLGASHSRGASQQHPVCCISPDTRVHHTALQHRADSHAFARALLSPCIARPRCFARMAVLAGGAPFLGAGLGAEPPSSAGPPTPPRRAHGGQQQGHGSAEAHVGSVPTSGRSPDGFRAAAGRRAAGTAQRCRLLRAPSGRSPSAPPVVSPVVLSGLAGTRTPHLLPLPQPDQP